VPHEPVPGPAPRPRAARADGAPLKVLVIGAISRIKGFETLLALARTVQRQRLPIEISLLGFSCDDPPLSAAGVQVLGRYADEELAPRIEALAPDLIFVPSIWPETYCYVLSSAMRAGCTVAAFDIGAQGRRLRQWAGPRLLLPLALSNDPLALAAALSEQVPAAAPAHPEKTIAS
jgi:glycosyltransferase involved in cell wall biosynthesis